MTEMILGATPEEPVKKSGQKAFGPKAIICAGGLLSVVAVVSLWAEISKGSKVSVPVGGLPPAVPMVKADREDLANEISLYGEFRPYQQILVHAKVSGYVQSIDVDIGDHVRAGQALAKLEIPELDN